MASINTTQDTKKNEPLLSGSRLLALQSPHSSQCYPHIASGSKVTRPADVREYWGRVAVVVVSPVESLTYGDGSVGLGW